MPGTQETSDMTKITSRTFESWGEFLAVAGGRASGLGQGKRDLASRESGRSDWYGGVTFEEAQRLALAGWEDGARKALAKLAFVQSAVSEVRSGRARQWGYDLTGDVVDIGRHLSGEPECWLTEQDGEGHSGKVVKVVASVAISGAVGGDAAFSRGAAVLAAVDAIEAAGKRVELWIAKGSQTHDTETQWHWLVPVKSAGQPLDVDRLAFALCSLAIQRRLFFSVQEQVGAWPNNVKPCDVPVEDGVIYSKCACRGNDYTQQEIRDEVLSICNQAGVSLELTTGA